MAALIQDTTVAELLARSKTSLQTARTTGQGLGEDTPVGEGMGIVADAALAAGGMVTGVMPRGLAAEEPPHGGLSELHLVGTMHERKALMAELSGAFLALPSGLGTLEEAFEAISWTQLRFQDKPTGFLNVNGFFESTMKQLDHMVTEGFVRQEHRDGIYFDDQPARLLLRLADFESPEIHKWIDATSVPTDLLTNGGKVRRSSSEYRRS
jgi:uncharacterized protein (TIGR00730 family)